MKSIYPQPDFLEEYQTNKTDLASVFIGRDANYLNFRTLFVAYYNRIPNFIKLENVDCKSSSEWLEREIASELKEKFYAKKKNEKKSDTIFEIYYALYDDLLLMFEMEENRIKALFRKTDEKRVEELIGKFAQFKKSRSYKQPELSLLVNTNYGLDTKSLKIAKPKLKIEENYNDDFMEIHKTIHKRLSKKNDKGLVLLHGKPGTGKTTYIRYLISSLKKKVIFLSPNLASAITNPELLSVLIEEHNYVFVIEDAENIIIDREIDGSSPLSALVN